MNNVLEDKVNLVLNNLEDNSQLIAKKIFIGANEYIEATILYINGLINRDVINRDILKPLMIGIKEDLKEKENLNDYICKKYICMGDAQTEQDINKVIDGIKRGKTILIIENSPGYIIIDTTGGEYRQISESSTESSIRGPREAFVENLEVNISILKRRIKDKNLVIEKTVIGKRSQTDVAILYIKDIANDKLINYIKERLEMIDVDNISSTGELGQYIENHTYTIFPQFYITERTDVVESNIMEGKVAIIVDGAPQLLTAPALFIDFFQTVEDYYERFIVSSFSRMLRIFSAFTIITLPSLYLNFIKFNVEIIPLELVVPLISSRTGIVLSPFYEILLMEIIIELLREGGLRLPSKVANTLSIVGGIIIGEMVVRAKVVSPETLVVIGISVISTFLIPNYEMALTIRLLRFPMLVVANFIGIIGIVLFWYIIIVHLLSLDSFGFPYITLNRADYKDVIIRAPLWKMNKRPEDIATKDNTRQSNFREKYRRSKLGKR
ncbi:spore germination protein [uncultured Clostridium sp.]|uniref:spore germination protein n=1 Tax=uncultured Clostridium sp. TaxID=59620 RepID=UPI0028F09E09|nr:spore germination protein [uncultured Clostridium sp.]